MKAGHRNITLCLPESLLRRVRVEAAKRNESMTALMERAVRKDLASEKDDEHQRAQRRLIQGMKDSKFRSKDGKITWRREDLYDRGEGRPWNS